MRDDGSLWVRGDAVRLSQVVRNLLSNAHRFTEAGGVIRVVVEAVSTDRVRLCVTDDGIGLDPEQVETIFEPFRRGHEQQHSSADGGLGLGLTIVRRLVEAHGGEVRASSEGLGHGTRMEVVLPLFDAGLASS